MTHYAHGYFFVISRVRTLPAKMSVHAEGVCLTLRLTGGVGSFKKEKKMDLEERIESLANEIIRKGELVNYDLIDLAAGGHMSMFHVGLSDEELVKRQKSEHKVCSTFASKNEFNIALDTMFSSRYEARRLAKWVLNDAAKARTTSEDFTDEVLGKVIKKNGAIKKVCAYNFVLQKKDSDYRNKITGLPFDFVTATVVE